MTTRTEAQRLTEPAWACIFVYLLFVIRTSTFLPKDDAMNWASDQCTYSSSAEIWRREKSRSHAGNDAMGKMIRYRWLGECGSLWLVYHHVKKGFNWIMLKWTFLRCLWICLLYRLHQASRTHKALWSHLGKKMSQLNWKRSEIH